MTATMLRQDSMLKPSVLSMSSETTTFGSVELQVDLKQI